MDKKIISIQKIQNDNVESAVFDAFSSIGAEKLMNKEGMVVLLKPNLLNAKKPEQGVTTHPEVLRAVIHWVKKFNPSKIYACDSSGGIKPGTTEKVFETSGLKNVCEEENIIGIPFEKTSERKIYNVENPLVLDHFTSSSLLDEADIIINLPKIKTHTQMVLTCCIKNMFGTLLLVNKPKTHAQFTTQEDFGAALADIYSVATPDITLIDGYLCMEGKGPSAGDVVKMDLILAGYDGVALDTAVCNLIDIPVNEVTYIKKAEIKGLGTSDLNSINFVGVPLNDVKRPFARPQNKAISIKLPQKIGDYLGKTLSKSKIQFNPEKCRLCATCWENCPTKAINPPNEMKKGNIPQWDKKKCITCYCCTELCTYEAVDFEVNIPRNFIFSWVGVVVLTILIGLLSLIGWIISLFFK